MTYLSGPDDDALGESSAGLGEASEGSAGAIGLRALPIAAAVLITQSRYRTIGVTPVRPPQPVESAGPVAQLIKPSTASRPSLASRTGPPESPQQEPTPATSPFVFGSTKRI